jgi:hypothetical protein
MVAATRTTQWIERTEGGFTPFFGVISFAFAMTMLLFAAIGWAQFSPSSLVTLVAIGLCVLALALTLGFAVRPDLVRRIGLGVGVTGTLLVLPFVIGGLFAILDGRMPHPEKITALASIGLVCSVYAVFAAVALRQEHRRRESPASAV